MKKYQFIDSQKATKPSTGGNDPGPRGFPIWLLCKILGIPESSYYDWNHTGRDRQTERDNEAKAMTAKIRKVHADSDSTYGAPRVRAELRDGGVIVSKRRVAELMAQGHIRGLSGREHSTTTTRRDRLAVPIPDLVNRDFHPKKPNVTWYGDITYIWVDQKFWYLATVIDAATKEVIGWRFADHMETSLVTKALQAAVSRRGGPKAISGVIFHTDRGAQYTSKDFRKVCKGFKILQSMGRTGVCYDNAAAESFFSTFKRELIHRYHWNNPKELHVHMFEWIETWYNRRRLHTTIGMRTPFQAYTDHINNEAA